MSFRFAPFCQRLFSTSSRARATVMPMENMAAAQLTASANAVPRLGRIAKWYLPTMALIAVGFGITNHLHDLNRKVHLSEPTQEERNMMLLNMYGERSSLEDMERAIAGLDSQAKPPMSKNQALEEAYGDKSSIKDLYRAMEIYEVQ
ncbi:hypothetical protein FB567DRAFT_563485 [Paraphoma chrysanthemicola]|uniref:Uncharacterized protein n=1 Tax=Paraphoma chrysanthemicola TaxID=798071 RepID=A0A8K0QWP2_9PLEO|nr:hypothetical protein FB567DRAFT_563485 [Paraphoma chrysanthemicola]